jgi:hypothetical protein
MSSRQYLELSCIRTIASLAKVGPALTRLLFAVVVLMITELYCREVFLIFLIQLTYLCGMFMLAAPAV